MITNSPDIIDDLFEGLQRTPKFHQNDCSEYRLFRAALEPLIRDRFAFETEKKQDFGPFGQLSLPFFEMGSITSLQLFGLDEMILFKFYHANRTRYRRVLDFGANIGLHSIIMAKCGFDVRSFEPDPVHIAQLRKNLALNDVETNLYEAAVSLEDGSAEFVRVEGNTTGSHIRGAKEAPYGKLEKFIVDLTAADPHLAWADFAKIDIEGHEAALITGLPPETWLSTDAMLEIGTPTNARTIFDHLAGTEVKLFSQKTGWSRVQSVADLPTSHREGSVFLSKLTAVPWHPE